MAAAEAPATSQPSLSLSYGSEICLRSTARGRCVCVLPVERNEMGAATVGGREAPKIALRFVGAISGLGLGEREERLVLTNAKLREDRGPVRFGDAIALRSRLAKEKCLGTGDEDGSVLFTRNLIGAAERWELLPGTLLTSARVRRRGDVVLSGDAVSLRTVRGDGYLAALDGTKADVCWINREISAATAWQMTLAGAPHWPTWHDDRPHLSGTFIVDEGRRSDQAGVIIRDSGELNEGDFVDDVISALAGLEGGAIRVVASDAGEIPDLSVRLDVFEERLRSRRAMIELSRRCLPTGEAFVRVRSFARRRMRYEFGRVAHALAAKLRVFLRDYLTFLAQLETKASSASTRERRELGMQQLWFWLQPAAKSMALLDRVCVLCEHLVGGPLLDALLDFACADDEERGALTALAKAAAEPYLDMLAQWLYRGRLDDPYREFCVVEDHTARRADIGADFNAVYWESRFATNRTFAVGRMLKAKADQITVTGKYWHVVRDLEDRPDDASTEAPMLTSIAFEDLLADADDSRLSRTLNAAHAAASTALLELVFSKERALLYLLEIKRIFLAGQGDFLVNFLDLADAELEKRVDTVNDNRLDSLLQLALTLSSRKHTALTFPVKAALAESTLIDHLDTVHSHGVDGPGGDAVERATVAAGTTGADAFVLELDVAWPLSIVISRRSVVKYQLIFRHVFRLKRVGRALLDAWTDQMATKDAYSAASRKSLSPAFCLRHRMLHFVHTLTSYVMFDVVETRHDAMLSKLSTELETLDQAIKDHDAFLDVVLRECLLTNHALFSLLSDMFCACERFATAVRRFTEAAIARGGIITDDSFKARQQRLALRRSQLDRTTKAAATYFDVVKQQAASWSALSARFLDRLLAECHLSYNSHLLDLYNRLQA